MVLEVIVQTNYIMHYYSFLTINFSTFESIKYFIEESSSISKNHTTTYKGKNCRCLKTKAARQREAKPTNQSEPWVSDLTVTGQAKPAPAQNCNRLA